MQQIKIDFDNPGLPQHLEAMEGDAQSRFFQATLYRSGAAYTPPAGVAYSIMYRGFGEQNQGWYDTIEDDTGKRNACVASGNVVTCEIDRHALIVPGHVSIVLCITNDRGYMLKSRPILTNARNDNYDDTVEVESYFRITGKTSAWWLQNKKEVQDLVDRATAEATKAKNSADASATSAEASKGSADNSAASASASAGSAAASARSESNAAGSATEAAGSASAAAESKTAAATSEINAARYEEAAKQVVTQNAKGYGGGYSRTFTLTAPQTGWAVLEAPIGIYRYYADVALADCTAKWNAFAAVLPESAMAAFVARVANIIETKDGSVRLYAVNAPDGDVKFTLSVFAVGSRTYSLTVPADGWVQAENTVWVNQWQCDLTLEDSSVEKVPMGMAALENTTEALSTPGLSATMETFDGYIRVYAKKRPAVDINIVVILLAKNEVN